jgi:hypothetical protein
MDNKLPSENQTKPPSMKFHEFNPLQPLTHTTVTKEIHASLFCSKIKFLHDGLCFKPRKARANLVWRVFRIRPSHKSAMSM